MTKEQEKETIKYLEFLQKEYLEDAKQKKENREITGYGTMEDIDKLRALYIGFALDMLKENSAEIEQKNTELAEKNVEIEKKDKRLNRQFKLLIKKDKIIYEMAKAFRQDDVRSVEEIIKYFERKSEE